MTEPARSSWGDIVKAAEESPQPVPASNPDPTAVAAVEIPAPTPAGPAGPDAQPAPVTVPPAGQYPYGVMPTQYSSMPVTPGPSLALKTIQVLAATAVLAAVGFGGYWAYDTILKKKDTHTEADAKSGANSKPATDAEDSSRSATPTPASAPTPGPPSASAPGGLPAGDEGTYLMLLRSKADMTITNPDRLLDLGKEVCVYLGTQTGSPTEVVVNVRKLLLQEGVTSTDGMHITGSAITALCPQHKSKIIPG